MSRNVWAQTSSHFVCDFSGTPFLSDMAIQKFPLTCFLFSLTKQTVDLACKVCVFGLVKRGCFLFLTPGKVGSDMPSHLNHRDTSLQRRVDREPNPWHGNWYFFCLTFLLSAWDSLSQVLVALSLQLWQLRRARVNREHFTFLSLGCPLAYQGEWAHLVSCWFVYYYVIWYYSIL